MFVKLPFSIKIHTVLIFALSTFMIWFLGNVIAYQFEIYSCILLGIYIYLWITSLLFCKNPEKYALMQMIHTFIHIIVIGCFSSIIQAHFLEAFDRFLAYGIFGTGNTQVIIFGVLMFCMILFTIFAFFNFFGYRKKLSGSVNSLNGNNTTPSHQGKSVAIGLGIFFIVFIGWYFLYYQNIPNFEKVEDSYFKIEQRTPLKVHFSYSDTSSNEANEIYNCLTKEKRFKEIICKDQAYKVWENKVANAPYKESKELKKQFDSLLATYDEKKVKDDIKKAKNWSNTTLQEAISNNKEIENILSTQNPEIIGMQTSDLKKVPYANFYVAIYALNHNQKLQAVQYIGNTYSLGQKIVSGDAHNINYTDGIEMTKMSLDEIVFITKNYSLTQKEKNYLNKLLKEPLNIKKLVGQYIQGAYQDELRTLQDYSTYDKSSFYNHEETLSLLNNVFYSILENKYDTQGYFCNTNELTRFGYMSSYKKNQAGRFFVGLNCVKYLGFTQGKYWSQNESKSFEDLNTLRLEIFKSL